MEIISSGYKKFTEEKKKSLKRWRFKVARRKGSLRSTKRKIRLVKKLKQHECIVTEKQ